MDLKIFAKKCRRFFYTITKPIPSFIVRLIWLKSLKGIENIPSYGSAIIVSNHASYMDFFMLSAVIRRRVCYLATKKLIKHSIIRWFLGYNDSIYIDRDFPGIHFFRVMIRKLENWNLVVTFPEGARSRTGKLQKAKLGFLKLAAITRVPIIPVKISGTFEILPPTSKRVKFKKICEIEIKKPLYFDELKINVRDKKSLQTLANKIMKMCDTEIK